MQDIRYKKGYLIMERELQILISKVSELLEIVKKYEGVMVYGISDKENLNNCPK